MLPSEPLPSRYEGVAERLPDALSDLAGPTEGIVILPLRLAWSGPSDFDISDDGERLTLYQTLIDCGQRSDFVQYVNASLLCRDWPRLRRLTSRRLIAIWESRLPDLAAV
jgi:hypothetical protein